jgi:hypothetical protein
VVRKKDHLAITQVRSRLEATLPKKRKVGMGKMQVLLVKREAATGKMPVLLVTREAATGKMPVLLVKRQAATGKMPVLLVKREAATGKMQVLLVKVTPRPLRRDILPATLPKKSSLPVTIKKEKEQKTLIIQLLQTLVNLPQRRTLLNMKDPPIHQVKEVQDELPKMNYEALL